MLFHLTKYRKNVDIFWCFFSLFAFLTRADSIFVIFFFYLNFSFFQFSVRFFFCLCCRLLGTSRAVQLKIIFIVAHRKVESVEQCCIGQIEQSLVYNRSVEQFSVGLLAGWLADWRARWLCLCRLFYHDDDDDCFLKNFLLLQLLSSFQSKEQQLNVYIIILFIYSFIICIHTFIVVDVVVLLVFRERFFIILQRL